MSGPSRRFSREYTLHDLRIRVSWDTPAVEAQLTLICTYVGLRPAQTSAAACPIRLDFCTTGPRPILPASASVVAEHHGITAWRVAQQIELRTPAATVQLDPARGTGVATLHPAVAHAPGTLRTDLVLYSLLLLLRHRGVYALHAACVATDGVGCLLVAASQSGKSTVAYSLIRQGWAYLTDDAVALRPTGDRVDALALRRDLCLAPDAARLFPDVVDQWYPCPLAEDAKQRLDIARLYPAQVVGTSTPQLLLMPQIAAVPQSRLAPTGKADALLGLIRQSALVLVEPSMTPRHLDVLTQLVKQTRCYRLVLGQDVHRAPYRVAALLSRLW